jgi:hypothetical protein
MFELTKFVVKKQIDKVKTQMNDFVVGESGITDAVDIIKGLVMIVVIGAIGVFIADRTLTATAINTRMKNATDEVNRTTVAGLANMSNNVLSAGDTGSSFIVILVIAFIGGIAISYLAFFGGSRQR